ncbi:hypothetical protein AN958_12074, partial [Leucoagaricus sp. SymC.cos]
AAIMLKRQRASSSLPSSPSIPQDTLSEDVIDIRNLKRRRVAPPSLDGQTRGWNRPSDTSPAEEEYEEEDYIEDKPRNDGDEAKFAQSMIKTEYAAVNSVLKEIHILHKHRQMFILPASTHTPNTPQNYPPRSEYDKNQVIHHPERQTPTEESTRVYEHYEGTNRSLASAFLSRRQHSLNQP